MTVNNNHVLAFLEPRLYLPSNNFQSFFFISAGCAQLLVGPASSLLLEHMYVLDSTRATSLVSERAKKQFEPRFGDSFKGIKVPAATNEC